MASGAKIVIVGGSWGGLATAWFLRNKLAPSYQIQLVADQPKTIIRASIPRVIFEDLPLEQLEFDLTKNLANSGISFLHGTLEGIDENKNVIITNCGTVAYDLLVISTGAKPAYEDLPGSLEFGHSICNPEKILATKQAILELKEGVVYASLGPHTPCDGPSMEVLLDLDHHARQLGYRDKLTLHFTTGKKALLPPDGPKVWNYLKDVFAKRGIHTETNNAVIKVEKDFLNFENGQRRPYDLFLYIAPYKNIEVFRGHSLADERGFIKVNFTTMRAEAAKNYNIYAVGDAVSFDGPRQAHIALLEAEVAAAHIIWRLTGRGKVPAFLPEFKCVMDAGGGRAISLYSQWLSDGEKVKISYGSMPYLSKIKFERLFRLQKGNPGRLHRLMMK